MADYDAFISYSHGSDMDLAPIVRDGLQRLAKPWNRRRALSVFLDQSSLEVTAELGSALDERIEDTRWLVLLMSEVSADSKWVGAEVARWAAEKSKDQLALVLTSGEIVWDEDARDFDYQRSTAVSEGMRGIYTGQESEPLYLDLRWTKAIPGGEKGLDLHNARFRSDIATLAAPIHGRAKDELEGEDIRQFKLARRLKRAAISGLAALTIIAVIAGAVALAQRAQAVREAQRASSRALAADALNNALVEPDLAALLALESVRVANTTDARGSLASVLSLPTRFLQRTDEHEAPVISIAFNSDGQVAATVDELGVMQVWDVAENPLEVPQATAVRRVELSATVSQLFVFVDEEQALIVALDDSGNLHILDLADDSLFVLEAPDAFGSAALSPSFGYMAGTTSDGVLHVYEINDDLDFVEHQMVDIGWAAVGELTFSPDDDASELAWGAEETVFAWRWREELEPRRVELTSSVTSIAFGPDGSSLAVGEEEGPIHLFDRSDLSLTGEVEPRPVNAPVDLAFKEVPNSTDGGLMLASAHSNGEVRLWTVFPGDGFAPFGFLDDTLLGHKEVTTAVAFAPQGRIASGSFDGEVLWWLDFAVPSLGDFLFLEGDDTKVRGVAFVESNEVVSVSDDTVRTWDIESRQGTDVRDASDVTAVDAAAGSIVLGLEDGTALVLDPDGTERKRLAGAHEGPIDLVVVSDDGTRLATASLEEATGSRIGIWNLSSDSPPIQSDLPVGFLAFSSLYADDGTLWIGGQSDAGHPIVLKIGTNDGAVLGMPLVHGDTVGDAVTALALSPDGLTLATGGSDRRIHLWDSQTMAPRGSPFRGHREIITGIVFSDEGETLISSDQAGEVIMWDVSLRRQFAALGGPADGINALDLEGNTLAAASEDFATWTWALDPSVWRDRACLLAGRNMTVDEWNRFGDGSDMVRHCSQWPFDGSGAGRAPDYSGELTD